MTTETLAPEQAPPLEPATEPRPRRRPLVLVVTGALAFCVGAGAGAGGMIASGQYVPTQRFDDAVAAGHAVEERLMTASSAVESLERDLQSSRSAVSTALDAARDAKSELSKTQSSLQELQTRARVKYQWPGSWDLEKAELGKDADGNFHLVATLKNEGALSVDESWSADVISGVNVVATLRGSTASISSGETARTVLRSEERYEDDMDEVHIQVAGAGFD